MFGIVQSELLEPLEKHLAHPPGVRDEVVLFDDFEHPLEANHVHEVAAERGVDPARLDEHIAFDLIDPPTRKETADLRLLAKRDKVRLESHLLVGPETASHADPGLDFIKNEQGIVAVGALLQGHHELVAEVVVTPFALDWFDEDGGDVARVVGEGGIDFGQCRLLGCLHICESCRIGREAQGWRLDPRPIEFREPLHFARVVGVGEAHRVARAAMETPSEVQDLVSAFRLSGGKIFLDLPIERCLQAVLDC